MARACATRADQGIDPQVTPKTSPHALVWVRPPLDCADPSDRVVVVAGTPPSSLRDGPIGERKAWSVLPQKSVEPCGGLVGSEGSRFGKSRSDRATGSSPHP